MFRGAKQKLAVTSVVNSLLKLAKVDSTFDSRSQVALERAVARISFGLYLWYE